LRIVELAVVECILLATRPMTRTGADAIEHIGRWPARKRPGAARVGRVVALIATVAAALAVVAPAEAQVVALDAPHVRPEHELRDLVGEASRDSPSIRGLLDRLEELNVTVYIRVRTFTQSELEGRVVLLSARAGHRYLVIELACGRPRITQMATLGHELFHAVEIADEPTVVDTRSLAAFYGRIGRRTADAGGRQSFETAAAADAGQRARRELLVTSMRRTNGT
jgi:hypothetical protein